MIVTYFGHSCFSVEIGGQQLLFDPFIRPNALASNIDVSALRPDYIFLSHGHADHVADAAEIANNSGAPLYANYEIADWFANQGVKNVHYMNTGGKRTFEWGSVKLVNAVHSSSMPDKSYGGTACGFIVESNEGNFYYAGDTALSIDMELIGRFHKLDFAILPIGGNFTMDVDDALICAEMIKCQKIIGVHYDTFPVIEINRKESADKFHHAGRELVMMNIGENKEITVSVQNPVY